jgi:hypothetical protein
VPQRCNDSFLWLRTFMSEVGPDAITRLVLLGHWRFMNRHGTACWAGVRRLGIICGLDKSTVARHRVAAIKAGWLIASARSPRSRFRQHFAAVPDTVLIPRNADMNTRECPAVAALPARN